MEHRSYRLWNLEKAQPEEVSDFEKFFHWHDPFFLKFIKENAIGRLPSRSAYYDEIKIVFTNRKNLKASGGIY